MGRLAITLIIVLGLCSWAASAGEVEGSECAGLPPELGAYTVHRSNHFNILFSGEEQWASNMATLLEHLHDRFFASMAKRGMQPRPLPTSLVWIRFQHPDDLKRYARQVDQTDANWLDSYYSARTNRVAYTQVHEPDEHSELAIDSLKVSHEAAHQFAFNSGLQCRGVMYPLWVTEGLATYFEIASNGCLAGDFGNPMRRRDLVAAHHNGRLVPLNRFVAQTAVELGTEEELSNQYAQAWGLFSLLLHTQPAQLRQYLRTLASGPMGLRNERELNAEFVAAFGDVEKVEAVWTAYVQQLDGTAVARVDLGE